MARALLAVLASLSLACAGGDAPSADLLLTPCTDPRPEMCTKEYRPVCGHGCDTPPCDERERRTHGNACDACADPTVSAWTPGSCEDGPTADPPTLR